VPPAVASELIVVQSAIVEFYDWCGGGAARIGPVPAANGFSYERRGLDVVIKHHGRVATTLRGARASEFLSDVVEQDEQQLMARLTGNYKRGNERTSANHPRNGG
jgi:hypothetical protein